MSPLNVAMIFIDLLNYLVPSLVKFRLPLCHLQWKSIFKERDILFWFEGSRSGSHLINYWPVEGSLQAWEKSWTDTCWSSINRSRSVCQREVYFELKWSILLEWGRKMATRLPINGSGYFQTINRPICRCVVVVCSINVSLNRNRY